MKVFWIGGSRYSFSIMYFDPLSFRMEVKIVPIHDVSAVGLRLDGDEGSFLAGVYPNLRKKFFFCTCHNFPPLSSVQIIIIPACCLLCVL